MIAHSDFYKSLLLILWKKIVKTELEYSMISFLGEVSYNI